MAKKFRDLIADWPEERREAARRRAEERRAEMPLHGLRRARALSQEHLAATLKQSQSGISRMERRTDMYVSTLRAYVRALGGELEILARFPEGDVRINQFEEIGRDEYEEGGDPPEDVGSPPSPSA